MRTLHWILCDVAACSVMAGTATIIMTKCERCWPLSQKRKSNCRKNFEVSFCSGRNKIFYSECGNYVLQQLYSFPL